MRSLLVLTVFTIITSNIHAQQHLIDLGAGITFSEAIVIDNKNTFFNTYSRGQDMFFFFAKYTCRFRQLQFSTGVSAWQYLVQSRPVGGAYLSIPVLVGRYWEVNKDVTLSVEAGLDWARVIANTRSTFHRDLMGESTWWTLFGTANVEVNWKRFNLGLRGQICLAEHVHSPTGARFWLVGLCTYLSYNLWDSFHKKRKKKSEEILFAGRAFL